MNNKHLESYPPLFRRRSDQTQKHNLHLNNGISQDSDSDPIPLIDLESLSSESLVEACENWGLFRLINHGVPAALLGQLLERSRELFSLSFEAKQALLESPGPLSYFWGSPALSPSGAPLTEGTTATALNVNWVEGFNASLSRLPLIGYEDPIVNDFRILLEDYGSHMRRIASVLFKAMVETLNSNLNQSDPVLSVETGIIRIHRYPTASSDNEKTWGISAHTDSSVLSILCQDQVSGLEFLKDNKHWLLVKPVPNTLIVHLGDMMQAMSNDKYMSVKHRVKVNKHKERISIGYFVFPHDNHVIHSSKYKPFTYSNFRAQVQQDLKATGLKIGLDRFKL